MRALVTGATGYLGSALTERLLADGHDVHAVLRTSSLSAAVPPAAAIHRYDGTASDVLRIVESAQPQWVFHLAASQTQRPTAGEIDALVVANVLLGTQLAYACSHVGVAAFVNTGTYSQRLDGDEFRPATLYAATKQAFVDILAYFADAETLPAITLELPGTYGPHDPRGKVLDLLIGAQQGGETLDVSPGEQVMDLVHVDDVVDGFIQAARVVEDDPSAAGSTFALHGSEQPTLRELVGIVEDATGTAIPIAFGALPYREREVMQASTTPTLPGWSPQVDLVSGIRRMASTGSAASS